VDVDKVGSTDNVSDDNEQHSSDEDNDDADENF